MNDKAIEILTTIGTIAATAAGPEGAAIVALAGTVAKIVNGEQPTDAELAHADAEREASNIRMNAAADRALLAGGTS